MESSEIVLLSKYDTTIDANLAKTKLDAYGIPCFLSDENFGSLFPMQSGQFSSVRLFVFQHDLLQASEVLRSNDQSAQ